MLISFFFFATVIISCLKLTHFNPSGRSRLWNCIFFFLTLSGGYEWGWGFIQWLRLALPLNDHLNKHTCCNKILKQYFSPSASEGSYQWALLMENKGWCQGALTHDASVPPPLHNPHSLMFAVLAVLISISRTADLYMLMISTSSPAFSEHARWTMSLILHRVPVFN